MSDDEVVSTIMEDYVRDLVEEGERSDDRELNERRNIKVETDVIDKAEGSARVELGDTKVLAGIKVETGTPFPDTPNKGVFTTNVELLPMASPEFESGPPREDAVELARVVDRGIRESETIDLESLVIKEAELVRIVHADVHVLDYNGNLLDAIGFAVLAALKNTTYQKIDYNEETGEQVELDKEVNLPITDSPIPVTFAKIDDELILDPNLDEDRAMESRITISYNDEGNINSIQKGGSGTLMVSDVLKAAKEGDQYVDEVVRSIEKGVEEKPEKRD